MLINCEIEREFKEKKDWFIAKNGSWNLETGYCTAIFLEIIADYESTWFKVTPAKNGRLFSVVLRSESLIVDADWRQSIAETNRSRQRYQCYVVVLQ